jgi:dehydrogenase/reductase SDR family protein 1
VAQGSGLVVNISSAGGAGYRFNVAYGVMKAAVERLAADMAHELRAQRVAVVALRPGNVRTERVLANPWPGDTPGQGDGRESPRFVGRVVAALAADPRIMERSGQVLTTAELGRRYGIADPDA